VGEKMSWVRYILNKPSKTLEVNSVKYTFPKQQWVSVTNPLVKQRVFNHADVFEVADFDIGMVKDIPNIKCHGKLVYTSDPEAVEILRESKCFALKVQTGNQFVFRVSVSDNRYHLLSALRLPTVTVGVYRMKGGWGDVVMSFAAAKAMKKQYPHLDIIYSCPSQFRELVDGDKDVAWQELNSFMRAGYGAYINLTAPCISYEVSHQPKVDKNRTEIFCDECETNVKQFKPFQLVDSSKLTWAKQKLAKVKRPIIGIVPTSCAPIRNWEGFEAVAKQCTKKYNSTNLIINADSSFEWKGSKNDRTIFGYSMGQVVAYLSQCDVVIGVDTGPMHSAASLGVPTIWVFTHIDGSIRTKGYSNVNVLQDKTCSRAPCWYDKPCSDGKLSFCGLQIKPKDIMNLIDKTLAKRAAA